MANLPKQGHPIWYELATTDLKAAEAFYGPVLGWQFQQMQGGGHAYHLASAGGDGVAGLMSNQDMAGQPPPHWLTYFLADSVDATTQAVLAAGGKQYKAPTDIPGTGRFAVLADPQGAVFAVLQPAPMDPPVGKDKGAFNQQKTGHGNWHELMTSDPKAAQAFYTRLFGWKPSRAMDMGDQGTYQIMSHDGQDFGAIQPQGESPVPAWLPYFGVDGASAAIERIKKAGGQVLHGPIEVPGPAHIAIAADPQGAYFAVVGPNK